MFMCVTNFLYSVCSFLTILSPLTISFLPLTISLSPSPLSLATGFSPIFKEKIKETTIQVGETVTLRCQVVGNPAPKLSWYRNDEVITSGKKT